MTKKRLFSGMQPSGSLHLGNYLGALQNWVRLQEDYEAIFCIVDWHAITSPYDSKIMQQRILDATMDYIAGGLDPEKCTIFVQSHVPQHMELCWYFNSVTPLGQLMRMTQFKAKTAQYAEGALGDNSVRADEPSDDFSDLFGDDRSSFLAKAGHVSAALFTYPVLQAADILLYQAEVVPVGEDQVQHVELTRDIARRFNLRYGDVFGSCQPLLSEAPRIMGLDGVNKMSKSLGNHIPLSWTRKEIVEAVTKQAASDTRRKLKTDPGVPEECNVYSWHKLLCDEETQAWAHEGCTKAEIGCFQCKKKVAQRMAEIIEPIRERRAELAKDPDTIRDILNAGAARCRDLAEETMQNVREIMGLSFTK